LKPDAGRVFVDGEDITDYDEVQMIPVRKKIGMVFQEGALFDSLSVYDNVAYRLHEQGLPEDQVEPEVRRMLRFVNLEDAIDKMPSELSGGMRKRIGLARTLILKPEIMLYDEPTTGLDTITSREISELILAIQKKNKTTAIIITHDMACAKLTADRIVVLKEGVMEAEGTYESLENSEDEWVRSFFI
jgi:phospholipid/cholesterol/gamma-HCH transport system ATP-binding protein